MLTSDVCAKRSRMSRETSGHAEGHLWELHTYGISITNQRPAILAIVACKLYHLWVLWGYHDLALNPSQNNQNFSAIEREEQKLFVFVSLAPERIRLISSTLAKKAKRKTRAGRQKWQGPTGSWRASPAEEALSPSVRLWIGQQRDRGHSYLPEPGEGGLQRWLGSRETAQQAPGPPGESLMGTHPG